MPPRSRSKKRSTRGASARGKKSTHRRTKTPRAKKKSAKKKSAKKKSSKRSVAAKRAWLKRRKKLRLIEAMQDSNWREIAMPTRDELYDYMDWMARQFEVEISEMYRMYWGYEP